MTEKGETEKEKPEICSKMWFNHVSMKRLENQSKGKAQNFPMILFYVYEDQNSLTYHLFTHSSSSSRLSNKANHIKMRFMNRKKRKKKEI